MTPGVPDPRVDMRTSRAEADSQPRAVWQCESGDDGLIDLGIPSRCWTAADICMSEVRQCSRTALCARFNAQRIEHDLHQEPQELCAAPSAPSSTGDHPHFD